MHREEIVFRRPALAALKRRMFDTRCGLIAILVILALVSAGCSATQEPIQIAISAWAGVEPAQLAADLGYYDAHGVDVEMVRFTAYTDSIEALQDGKTDGGMHTLDDAMRYFSKGRDVRVVLLTDTSYGGDGIVARAGIHEVQDLADCRVGVETGTVSHFSLLKALEVGGLTQEDIDIVSIPAWEIKEAFLAGDIDAGVTWEPYLTSAAEEGNGNVIITSRQYPETIITTMVFDARTVEKRPQDVERIVAAYFDAVDYTKAHPQDAYRRMADAEGISAEAFRAHAAGIRYLDLEDNVALLGTTPGEEGDIHATARELARFLMDNRMVETGPDVHVLLENRFVAAAQ